MNTVVFLFLLFLVGASGSTLAHRRLGVVACCLLAWPLGLTVYVLLSLAVLASPFPYRPVPILLAHALWVVATLALHLRARARGEGLGLRELGVVALAGLALLATAAVCASFDASVFSYDSEVILAVGRAVAHHGEIGPEIGPEFASRGIFQALVQGASVFLGVPYLFAAPPLLTLTTLALWIHCARRALLDARGARGATLLALLSGLALATPYFMLVQALYVHESLPSGMYLGAAMACLFLAEDERETAWLPFGFAFLLAFTLQRIENPVPAALVLLMLHSESRLPAKPLLLGSFAVLLCVELWYLYLFAGVDTQVFHLRLGIHVLTHERIGAVLVGNGLAAIGLVGLRLPWLAWLRGSLPWLISAALGVGLLAALAARTEHMVASTAAVWQNMNGLQWGGFWSVCLVLSLLSLGLPRIPLGRTLLHGSVAIVGFILLLGAARSPYAARWSDSAHRMFTHAAPPLLFYLLVRFGRADRESPAGGGS